MHIFVTSNKKRNMNVDNVKSQMRKGMLEYCILLLVHKEPSYASDIIQKLKEAKLIVVEGTLYPLLTRLKNDDLLEYEWVESTQGPPRKYYKLTTKGEVFLGELELSCILQFSSLSEVYWLLHSYPAIYTQFGYVMPLRDSLYIPTEKLVT